MLAIVIPYYKKTFFRKTLESLANQTDKRFQVYIGDDASPEDPMDLIEVFQDQIDLTYKRFNENRGGQSLVKQWERCIELINNEEWITILGDDDVYEPHVVEQFHKNLNAINEANSTVVRFATRVIDENDEVIGKLCQHPEKEKATDFLMRKFAGGTRSTLSEYFFKTALVKKIKFKEFPLAWSSDVLAVVEFSDGRDIFTVNKATVHFRLSSKNITGKGDSVLKNEAWFQFYAYLLKKYGKQYPTELVNSLFDRLEKVQLNNKKTPRRWIKLFGLYVYHSKYSRFLSLGKKIKKSIQ